MLPVHEEDMFTLNSMLQFLKADREFYIGVVEKIERSITSLERTIYDSKRER